MSQNIRLNSNSMALRRPVYDRNVSHQDLRQPTLRVGDYFDERVNALVRGGGGGDRGGGGGGEEEEYRYQPTGLAKRVEELYKQSSKDDVYDVYEVYKPTRLLGNYKSCDDDNEDYYEAKPPSRDSRESGWHYNYGYQQQNRYQDHSYVHSSNTREPQGISNRNRHMDRSSQHSDMPSLVESETSSSDGHGSWQNEENEWDRKAPGRSRSYPKHSNSTSNGHLDGHIKTIEISPGFRVRLRGADETWRAVENDFYMPTQCIACSITVFCIQDADYVVCPECRVVSPMEEPATGSGGCGLGFSIADLARWTEDIERSRRVARKMAG
jgi:hypothetical protein